MIRKADDPIESGQPPFRNRTAAGERLAERLQTLLARPSVIAAIPRGGVAVALPIVERLRRPLAIVHACKLTAPGTPEVAFGALDEDGQATIDREAVTRLSLAAKDIESIKTQVAAEMRWRAALYGARPLVHYLPGLDVVLVDDGLASGLTMRAAVHYVRRLGAREVTVAVPCASESAATRFRNEADRFVSMIVGDAFGAVGGYYADFAKLTDQQVAEMITRADTVRHASHVVPVRLRVSFKNSRGMRLIGRLVAPAGNERSPVVVFAHGSSSGKHSPHGRMIAERLIDHGIASFLVDFTGHGESEGRPDDCTVAQQTDDLTAAVDILTTLDEVDSHRVGIVSLSSGAPCALAVAARDSRIRALVLCSATLAGVDDASARVITPTLLILGEADAPIQARNESLLEGLGGPRRLETIPSDLFEDPGAIIRASDVMAEWFRRHFA
jgi:predicted phosphoribosyltransferase/dienelactone hydrolase